MPASRTRPPPKYGQTDGSGGRWGVAVKHAVRPGTEYRASKTFSRNVRGSSFCGVDVFQFAASFDPDDSHACSRCATAVRKHGV